MEKIKEMKKGGSSFLQLIPLARAYYAVCLHVTSLSRFTYNLMFHYDFDVVRNFN